MNIKSRPYFSHAIILAKNRPRDEANTLYESKSAMTSIQTALELQAQLKLNPVLIEWIPFLSRSSARL